MKEQFFSDDAHIKRSARRGVTHTACRRPPTAKAASPPPSSSSCAGTPPRGSSRGGSRAILPRQHGDGPRRTKGRCLRGGDHLRPAVRPGAPRRAMRRSQRRGFTSASLVPRALACPPSPCALTQKPSYTSLLAPRPRHFTCSSPVPTLSAQVWRPVTDVRRPAAIFFKWKRKVKISPAGKSYSSFRWAL